MRLKNLLPAPKKLLTQASAVLVMTAVSFAAMTSEAQDPQQMMTLMKQMQQQIKDNDHSAAADTAAKLMAQAEKVMGPANADVIRMGVQRAVLLRNVERLEDAVAQCDTTIQKAKQHLGSNHEIVAQALSLKGSVIRLQGDFAKARKALEDAVKILESNPTASKPVLAEAYSNFADLLSASGELALGKSYGEKALQTAREQFGPNHPNTAVMLNNLGMSMYHLGEMDEAEKWLGQALAAYKKIYGPDHGEIASSLNNMGLLYNARGKYDEAIEAYQRGMEISLAKFGKDNGTTANLSNGLGLLYSELGKHDLARPLLQQALAYREKTLGDRHPSTATTQHNLGLLLLDLKDYDAARQKLQKAADAFESGPGANPDSAAGPLAYLGMTESLDGDVPAAIQAFDQSRRKAHEAVWKVLPSLGTNAQQKLMGRTFRWTLYSSLSLAIDHPNDQTVIEATAESAANGKGIATEALAAARKEKDEQGKSLDWISLGKVRSVIPENAVLIDIVRQDMIKFDASSYEERLGNPHYVAWIVRSTGKVHRVDLGDATKIDQQVEKVRQNIAGSAGPDGAIVNNGEIEASKESLEHLSDLSKLIWKPLSKHVDLEETKQIILSPDGALWLAPWSALPSGLNGEGIKDNDPALLIERFTISTTPSGRALAMSSGKSGNESSSTNATGDSAIFANASFDLTPSQKASTYQRIYRRPPTVSKTSVRSSAFDATRSRATPLPGTAREAAAILPRMTSWLSGSRPKLWQGSEAMESVARQLKSPRSVVFSTHGFFKSDDASGTVDPLARCGLLLAGCNSPQSAIEGDDGVLLGIEITSIDLAGTELVVLSACETGVGKVEDGNGIAGLRRAFHLAGAKSVASTLWQIPDLDTAKLMSDFFDSLSDGSSKAEALQAAQLERIKSRRKRNGAAHPFFWAGFTISGS